MKRFFSFVVIFQLICQNSLVLSSDDSSGTPSESVDNDMIVLHLDDNTNRILYDLFIEVFGNKTDNSSDYKIELPVSTVAELYHNYTQQQLDSLRTELTKLDNRFDIVREKVNSLQKIFLLSNVEYSLTKNLSQYERHFIHVGERLIPLQKLVLKFTIADKPIDINNVNRNGRKSLFGTVFDRLSRLLLGVSSETPDSQQKSQFLSSNQINNLIILMKSLQSLKNVSTNQMNLKMKSDVVKLQTMLYRLQQIQELNRLAEKQTYLRSSGMNPYGYEAILNLVKIMGTASGQNQLRTILSLFTTPVASNKAKPNKHLSPEKIRTLMKALEEQEKERRQQLENQRQKQILEELLRNQQKQQQQINSLIALIESHNNRTHNEDKHKGNNGNNNGNNHKNNGNNLNDIFDNQWNKIWETSTSAQRTTTLRPTTSANQNEILNKLREQRRQLNNLLKTLGTDFNNNMPTKSPTIGTDHNMGKTHETFNNILKTIGPMIGTLAQSGLIPPNQMQITQNSLNDLLKQNPNHIKNPIQYDSYKSKASQFVDLLNSILNF